MITEKILGGPNQWSDEVGIFGKFTLTIWGNPDPEDLWSATVTVQRWNSVDERWEDTQDFTAVGLYNGLEVVQSRKVRYRVGIKAGNWTSGSLKVKLEQ